MLNPFHYISLRKRVSKKLEPYPHPDKMVRFVDRIILFVGVLSPIMTIPQIYTIYMFKNAAGVSFLSWFSYTMISAVWVLYGFLHKEKAILVSQTLWIFMGFFVCLGAYIYK